MELPVAPLFPLPDTILFPGQIIPLQIFESRYREMTHDLLDGRGDLIIGTVLGDDRQQLAGVAPVQSVAGLGRLERYEQLDDGRFLIIVLGTSRVFANPVSSDKSYPMASYEVIESTETVDDDSLRKVKELIQAKQEFSGLPEETSASQLVDILIMTAEIPVEDMYHLYSISDLPERTAQILHAYTQE